jgi:cobyrinic acid a,c-diamide synthase
LGRGTPGFIVTFLAMLHSNGYEEADLVAGCMNIPRVVIAGARSGVGKTTVSIGLMTAIKEAGFQVQAFKVGPDYIDPSYHRAATGRPSENLDSWMVPKDQIIELFTQASKGADMAVIEGVMGLYDGISGLDETGSTAQIGEILRCPVILVIDAHDVARTAAAIVLGYKKFNENINIAGVILNRVTGETHAVWCKEAIESATKIPVVGWLPVNKEIELPERHLGLIPTPEKDTFNVVYPKIRNFFRNRINLNMIVDIAKSAEETPEVRHPIYPSRKRSKSAAIGLAFDEAFNFYYQSNINLLEAYGAEIKRFSPIHDKEIPADISGLYFGGGFPEILPKELEANKHLRKAIKKAAEEGMPIYAECAGLMYLTDSIADFNGKTYDMVDVLDGKTLMTQKTLVTYSLAEVERDTLLCRAGSQLKGHEFHNSVITDIPSDAEFAYAMKMGEGIKDKKDGWMQYNVLASYMHIHFAQNPKIVKTFIANCKKHKF